MAFELPERYWKKVHKTASCWLWTARLIGGGYGGYNVTAAKSVSAHRLMWESLHDEPIPPKWEVCHHCDVKNCVNPAHLFLGTKSDNMRDCARKGRNIIQRHPEKNHFHHLPAHLYPRGEAQGSSKLTTEQVLEMRRLRAEGTSSAILARQFNINPSTVRGIVARRAWKHV